MSDILKCPFCKEEIISDLCFLYDKKTRDYINGTQIYKCNKCGLFGTKALWQELIRTRKALDVAIDALGYYASENSWDETNRWMFVENGFEFAKDVLEQITALEQKE